MALRTFHANPSIGGFGGENSLDLRRNRAGKSAPDEENDQENPGGDVFCQIVKELVENAIDACSSKEIHSEDQTGATNRRVKVEIQPWDDQSENEELLLKVSDNGVGMENIQNAVDAFQSSKENSQSAGRYGIGLTLSLLHAQRLVSNSYAVITSGTKDAAHFTRAWYVVNSVGDSITCYKQEDVRKANETESGTCVSLLVPGGASAKMAWPRLESYFNRFQLSLNLCCSLEVLAPTLTTRPIYVRTLEARHGRRFSSTDSHSDEDESRWSNELEGPEDDIEVRASEISKPKANSKRIQEIFRSVQSYVRTSITIENVAHSTQPIRLPNLTKAQNPRLEVDVVVVGHKNHLHEPDNDESEGRSQGGAAGLQRIESNDDAKIKLVRMVNGFPMMDSAEASACGLVQGISNKTIWGSFGLTVSRSNELDVLSWLPMFDLRDSDQVAHFFQRKTHELLRTQECISSLKTDAFSSKRKITRLVNHNIPAKLRLGEVLVIVNVFAEPSSLPLPTLSKGRIPLNHRPIDQSLQFALRECLRSLQKSNPDLLLTPKQLRKTQREARYMPAAASALARIICNTENRSLQRRLLQTVNQWKSDPSYLPHDTLGPVRDKEAQMLQEGSIAQLVEERLRGSVAAKEKAKIRSKRRSRCAGRRDQFEEEAAYSDASRSAIADSHHDDEENSVEPKKVESTANKNSTICFANSSFCDYSEASSRVRKPRKCEIRNSSANQVAKANSPGRDLYCSFSDDSEKSSSSLPERSLQYTKSKCIVTTRKRCASDPVSSFDDDSEASPRKLPKYGIHTTARQPSVESVNYDSDISKRLSLTGMTGAVSQQNQLGEIDDEWW